MRIVQLHCESPNSRLPEGENCPRFSWKLDSDIRGDKQAAFQVLVASSEEILNRNGGDLWNSGRVESGESIRVKYAGLSLVCGARCYWKVRVWDKAGQTSEWSEPSSWDTGLLHPSDWSASWIGRPDAELGSWYTGVLPAPYFRRVFHSDTVASGAKAYICGLGYYELYINGRKVGDHVLDPVVSQYEKSVRYVAHDISEYLVRGENVFGVILGNGWYNCHTPEVWHFDKASWRDYPKLLLQVEAGGKTVLCSDASWKVSSGPIVFDGLRNGETYDARLELTGWLSPDYDDSQWKNAMKVAPPGGALQQQLMPPCKVMKTLPVIKQWTLPNGDLVCDMGQNMTGWARIVCTGKAGEKLTLRYAELLKGDDISQDHISIFIKGGECQTDHYILKGGEQETWEPRFTYHGFRYVRVSGLSAGVTLEKIEGRLVYSAFDQIGKFACSNETFNRLQECTEWSYINNFTGIPTDCPHREKNGWTGDAQLAIETGLFNFSGGPSYNEWMDSFADVQRLTGQLPGIVPSTGWGFNFGSGPAWDSAFLLIPWNVYLFTGDDSAIKTHYDAMKKYVDYCTGMATGHILYFGLGDWNHFDPHHMPATAITSTGYYYIDCLLISKFAALTGRSEDQKAYAALAGEIREAFNRHFYKGDGIYGNGEQTALACALYQGLVDDSERAKVAAKLTEAVEANTYKADFGILGAKYVPRALTENGRVDSAFKVVCQPEYPGWAYWLEQGATTLWESWDGGSSQNHVMFGDISAWFYSALAGINPDPAHPGFKHILLHLNPVEDLTWVKAEHDSPYGLIRSDWKVEGASLQWEILIPVNTSATVRIPAASLESVTCDSQPADAASGVNSIAMEKGCAVYEVESGSYRFISPGWNRR